MRGGRASQRTPPRGPWSDRARPAPPSRGRSTSTSRSPASAASVRASSVLPVPGAPWRRTPAAPAWPSRRQRRGHCAGHCRLYLLPQPQRRPARTGPPGAPRLPSPRGRRSAVRRCRRALPPRRAPAAAARVRRRLPARRRRPAARAHRRMDLRPRRVAWARARVDAPAAERAQGGGGAARNGAASWWRAAHRSERACSSRCSAAGRSQLRRSTVRPRGASPAHERDERGERGVQVLLIVGRRDASRPRRQGSGVVNEEHAACAVARARPRPQLRRAGTQVRALPACELPGRQAQQVGRACAAHAPLRLSPGLQSRTRGGHAPSRRPTPCSRTSCGSCWLAASASKSAAAIAACSDCMHTCSFIGGGSRIPTVQSFYLRSSHLRRRWY